MNKFNSLYPTQQYEPEETPLKDNYNRFTRRLDEHIKHNIGLKKTQYLKQSAQMKEHLNKIKEKSGHYKRKIYQEVKEFEDKVENVIRYDIRKYEQYQGFFKGLFEELESNMSKLKALNRQKRKEIQTKRQQVKTRKRQHSVLQLLSAKHSKFSPSDRNLTTKQSSTRLSGHESRAVRIKTDPSLPLLKPYNNQRMRTLMTQYEESPPHGEKKNRSRTGSYMGPIGSIRVIQQSSLEFLGDLLSWYQEKVDPESNWFLKVLYTPRNYSKMRSYLKKHNGLRKVFYQK